MQIPITVGRVRRSARALLVLLAAPLALAAAGGCSSRRPAAPDATPRTAPAPSRAAKRLDFALLEDYDKGESLTEVARDFALMKELGVTTWRGSLGWDDYEPARGEYDFAWLHRFAALARDSAITLRPYIGYTPEWASRNARAGQNADSSVWNDPPADPGAWGAFVSRLVTALGRYPHVASYEIYNEENTRMWWDGSAADYNAVLRRAAAAIRPADRDASILFGGMVWPDADWLEAACDTHGNAASFDVIPFHAYPETWTPESVSVESYLGPEYRERFLGLADGACGGKPVWINETGYATTPGKSERDQAGWWARAIATFAAEPRVVHVGIYEVKDQRPNTAVIGDAPNYYLGLTRVDRTRKLAFHTVKLLVGLLGHAPFVVADDAVTTAATAGRAGRLYHHAFVLADGRQLLMVWDKSASPTLRVRLPAPARRVTSYALDGTPSPHPAFDGQTLDDVRLARGEVRIFVAER
jgi:hypothetical protein